MNLESTLRAARRALAGSLLATALTALQPAPPSAAQGDLASLSCKVTLATVACPGSLLLEVEVRNEGTATAEPAVFKITTSVANEVRQMERCPLPYSGRTGRGIAAKMLRKYWLQIASAGEPKGIRVEVAQAAFHREKPVETAPVTILSLQQGEARVGELPVAATIVRAQNQSGVPVDAIVLVTYELPEKGRGLLPLRLLAGETREFAFHRRPHEFAFGETGGTDGVRITKCEVVDWTSPQVVAATTGGAAPANPGIAAFLQAYDRWVRWPEPWPNGEGTFTATYVRSNRADGALSVHPGTFQLKDVAPPILDIAGNPDLQAREAIEKGVDLAFGDLRRMSRKELEQRHELSVPDQGRVLLDGPGWYGMFGNLVDVRDGAIVKVAPLADQATSWQTWRLQPEGTGYLVVAKETTQLALGKAPTETERWSYVRRGRWIVPSNYRRETAHSGFRESLQVTFSCGPLRQRGEVMAGPPQGLGIDELRKGWDGGYRYPSSPVPLRARLEVRINGTDLIWQGERRITGTLLLREFTGFRNDASGWKACEPRIEGKGVTPEAQQRLGAAVDDRLRMWASRDFAGRRAFDDIFRGARVLPDAGRPGVFTLQNCEFEEVEIRDGRVVRVRFQGGQDRRIEWQRLFDNQVPVKVTTGDEVVTAVWKQLDKDWSLPVEIEIKAAFGKEWGSEFVKLADLSIKP